MTRSVLQPAWVVILCGVVAALHVGKLPPAIPLLQAQLGVTLVQAGFLLSLVQLAGMLAGVLLGLAADGFGLRRSVLWGLAVLAVSSALGAWVSRPVDLLALRACEGLGVLMVALPAPSLLRQVVPPANLARFLGMWGAYMPTGTALALLLGPWVLGSMGWVGWSMLMAAATTAVWVLARHGLPVASASAHRPPTAGQGTGLPHVPVSTPPAAGGWRSHRDRLVQTLSAAGPWWVALAFAMYSSQWLAVVGFLPSVYAQAGVSGQLAGVLTAVVCAANILGNVGAGRLLHNGVSAKTVLTVGFVTMGVMAWLAFHPVTATLPGGRFVCVWLFSAVGGVVPGTLFSLAVALAPSRQTVSTTVGWVQQCSSAGQFAGPPLVAWVAAQQGGWQHTWMVTGAAAVIGLMLVRSLPAGQDSPR